MNILPLVFAFLIVLMLCINTIIKESTTTQALVNSFIQYKTVESLAISKLEMNQYTLAEPANEKKKKPTDSEKNDIPYTTHRSGGTEASKFNLAPLFNEPTTLYRCIATTLLKNLYGLETIDDLLKAENPTSLIELYQQNPTFYKLFKGTQTGYPPLEDYFTFNDEKNTKPLSFRKASIPLLVAVFGQEITDAIINAEKEKWEKDHKKLSLTKEELTNLINNKFMGKFQTTDIDILFHFTHDKSSPPNIATSHNLKIKRGTLQTRKNFDK